MAPLRETKAIGVTASILLLVGAIANADNVLSLVAILLGLILLLVAAKYLSEITADVVYKDMMYAVACVIIGLVVGSIILFNSFRPFVGLSSFPAPGDFATFISTILAGLVIVWFFFVLAAIFTRRSFSEIAHHIDADMFRLAGRLYLYGAVLIILLGVGFILIFVAIGVQLAAFLSLPDEAEPRQRLDPWGRPLPSASQSPSQPAKKT